jgi:hypothetical protein
MSKIKKYADINKYKILEDIQECFLYLTDFFKQTSVEYVGEMASGEYMLYLNDTEKNKYADNNYFFELNLDNYPGLLPLGISNNINFLSKTSFYTDLKSVINRLGTMSVIKHISFYYRNLNDGYDGNGINIEMIVNSSVDNKRSINDNNKLLSIGFSVGEIYAAMEFNKFILVVTKPEHGDDKIGIFNKTWDKIAEISLEGGIYFDEDSIQNHDTNPSAKEIVDQLSTEYMKMKPKTNNPIKFLTWLKNNTNL